MLTIIKQIKIAGFLMIVLSLFYYQIIKGDYYANKASSNYIRLIPREAPRGLIFDRKSKLIVKNELEFQVCLFSGAENEEILEEIAPILEVAPEALKKNFKVNFVAPFIPTVVFSTTDRDKILKLEERNISQATVVLRPRRYVNKPYSFAHLVGYTRKLSRENVYLRKYGYSLQEEIGYSGIELAYDNYLRGRAGGSQFEIDSKGRLVNFLGEKASVAGKDLYTTLDIDIQSFAQYSIRDFKGSLIFIESESGKVLSLASSPTFDINSFTEDKEYFAKISGSRFRPLINRTIQGEYPLGSVFKIAMALAALEEEKINPATTFACDGVFRLNMARFRCWNTHGIEDVVDALTHSCNVFFYNLGLRLGPKAIHHYASILGFGKATGIDLPFEKKGFLASTKWKEKTFHEKWYPGDSVNSVIGQGYNTVTPMQVAKLISFFASGGYLIQPYLVERIEDLEIPLRKKDLVNLDQKNIEMVTKGMRRAVKDEKGTAHILESLDLNIAGKTGTAQVAGRKSHGWFAGFFPYQEPKYIIVVMLENSESSFKACQVARDFLSRLKENELLDL
jgi:penicillin-binding protein 2